MIVIKRDELSNAGSCLNKAHPDEMIFVLRSKDRAAPAAIRAWIQERIRLGYNEACDAKLLEAECCAQAMQQADNLYR